ncbi:MAG: ROK family protein [Oscillospiraceae bacterium]|nr:ROK family protein [Oscillospiraceae bacterium]
MYYLGIDLGGINIAAAVVDEAGKILGRYSRPTPKAPAVQVADEMARAARAAVEQAGLTLEQIASLGVGSPGAIDPTEGTVLYWCNLDFEHVPLGKLLEDRLRLPVYLENDANAAALGEYAAGAGKDSTSMVAITLGTGIGGGAVLNGKLYTGFNYAGMEVGHFVLEYHGRPCNCGRRGCFEAYCSATALIRQTRAAMEAHPDSLLWTAAGSLDAVEGRTAFAAQAQGDPAARSVVEEYQQYLACGIASLINIFQPEVFCVGGGVANAGETLLAPVRAMVAQEDYARNNPRQTRIVRAALGNDAGLIGAALLPVFR